MAFTALPTELRSLCRRLTSSTADQLSLQLPGLLQDVLRCQEPLSRPQEPKSDGKSSEATVLVHKLKTQITTLLNGKSPAGRFVATAMVKCVLEAGGWECLRASEPWVRGLLSILQKRDPVATKELCLITITKIYVMLQSYQTLIREIVTPTLPAFATACLQILKPPVSSKAAKAPMSLIQTIFEALSALIPLYPTTLRPFGGQLRAAARPYLATTSSSMLFVPTSLQDCSRRLVVLLHMTAAKGGGSDEWAKSLGGHIQDFHQTADQVLRAVKESWEPVAGYRRTNVDFDASPAGGGENPDQLPPWEGIQAGSERLLGLLDVIKAYLSCKTKVAVVVPISALVDISTRISSIMPPMNSKEKAESVQMNAAVGREERDELWTAFPKLQVGVMQLLAVLARRLGPNYLPLAPESLDQVIRIFESGFRYPEVRMAAFQLIKSILVVYGPALDKTNVNGLTLVIKACCRDLLAAAGHLVKPKQQASSISQNGSKTKTVAQNADSFLSSQEKEEMVQTTLSTAHVTAAEELLVVLFSHLPQDLIASSTRALMLRAAILSRSREAQIASVLHPARDKSGRIPAVILPYLTQQFPHDDSVEVLRFNFRPISTQPRGDIMDLDLEEQAEEEDESSIRNDFTFDRPFVPSVQEQPVAVTAEQPEPKEVDAEMPDGKNSNTSVARETEEAAQEVWPLAERTADSRLKRKLEESDFAASKRVEVAAPESSTTEAGPSHPTPSEPKAVPPLQSKDEDASSDDESVHLNMELDSSEDEGGEEQGGQEE